MFGRFGKKKGNYAYTVARVKAKKSHLFKDDAYSKMLLMSLPEISRFISESGYSEEITELTGKFEGIDLIEHATYRNMAGYFKGILDVSTGELHDMLAAVLQRWDVWNLKVILRGKSFGIDPDSVREDLVPAGELALQELEKMIALETVGEVIDAYCKLTETVIPPEIMDAYKTDGVLTDIEDFLDKEYYRRLLESIDPSSKPTRLLQDYIRNEIDVVNLETLLKLKVEGVVGEQAMRFVIPNGKEIDRKTAERIAAAATVEEAMGAMSKLSFYGDIKDALADTGSLTELVSVLKKVHISQARTFSHLHPLSIIPIIDFMIHKEIEVNNIRTVARGLASGLDRDVIKDLLVVV
ncbi:MAG: ATP synthase A1 subunit C [Thermoplasmatales archaeon]|nr:ATP synthase A1 subunit C [Thermoplasmatales archaeon]